MRHYTPDSPHAAARLLALAILADGGLDVAELRVLDDYEIEGKLGIDKRLFDEVIKDFCFDLAQYSDREFVAQLELDRETIGHLLRDIRNAKTQMELLRMMVDIVNADGSLVGGEAVLIAEAMVVWGLDLHRVAIDSRSARGSVSPRALDRRSGDRGKVRRIA